MYSSYKLTKVWTSAAWKGENELVSYVGEESTIPTWSTAPQWVTKEGIKDQEKASKLLQTAVLLTMTILYIMEQGDCIQAKASRNAHACIFQEIFLVFGEEEQNYMTMGHNIRYLRSSVLIFFLRFSFFVIGQNDTKILDFEID